MKKIITLLLVIVMMFTMAFSVSAANVTEGLNISFVEGADGIVTATINATGLSAMGGAKVIFTYDSTILTLLGKDKAAVSTVNYANVVEANTLLAAWTGSLGDSSAKITLDLSKGTGSNIDCSTSTDLCKIYFEKADGATLASDSFKLQANKYTAKSGYTNDGATVLLASDATKYSWTVTPYVAPVTGWTETNSDGETITIKFPTQQSEVGNASALTGTTKPATSYVEFGKNTNDYALEAPVVVDGKITNADKCYSINYAGKTFYGNLPVAINGSWAIVVVDTSAN